MKKLLSLALAMLMLSAGMTAFAAEPHDAYLESYSSIVTQRITDEDFSTDLEGWARRGNTPTWQNAAGPDGATGYMNVNASGAPSIQKSYAFGEGNVGKYYRLTFKMKSSAVTGNLFIYHDKDRTNSFIKPQIKGTSWYEYSFCLQVKNPTQLFVIYTDTAVQIDIDDWKIEMIEDDIYNLAAGTYKIPSKVWQNSDGAVSGKVISALYSVENELLDVDVKPFTTSGIPGTFAAVETEIEIPEDLEEGAYIKNMLWEDYISIMPYCDSNEMFDGFDFFNGGFEIRAKDPAYIAEGWGRRNTVPVELTTDAHSGKYAVKFIGTSTGIINGMGARNAFGSALPATQGAQLRFWAKTEGSNLYPKLALYLTTTGNNMIGTSNTIGTEWAQYTINIPSNYCTGATVNDLFLYPAGDGNNANTTYYVDDITIVPLG